MAIDCQTAIRQNLPLLKRPPRIDVNLRNFTATPVNRYFGLAVDGIVAKAFLNGLVEKSAGKIDPPLGQLAESRIRNGGTGITGHGWPCQDWVSLKLAQFPILANSGNERAADSRLHPMATATRTICEVVGTADTPCHPIR